MIFQKICKKVIVVVFLMGLVACSHAEKQENIKPKPSEKKEAYISYEEQVIPFEEDRAYGTFELRMNSDGNAEYVSLIQEQLTDKLKAQSFSHVYSGDSWQSKETEWGEKLNAKLKKEINLKKRIYKSNLVIGADAKMYITYNFFHPNAILEKKGVDYEYFVSNLLFCVDMSTNKVQKVPIPEYKKDSDSDAVDELKCSAFADGKLLIQGGENISVYDPATNREICNVEDAVSAGSYVTGDGVFYSAKVDSDGVFNICVYNENTGEMTRRVPLETYDAETMKDVKNYKLKVYEYDLYVACKEGIYCLSENDEKLKKIVDGVKDNLRTMTIQEEYIYDFIPLQNEQFAIHYRKLLEDEKDFEQYNSECLAIYTKTTNQPND